MILSSLNVSPENEPPKTTNKFKAGNGDGMLKPTEIHAITYLWLSPFPVIVANESVKVGIPDPKDEIILVVTKTGKGDNPKYTSGCTKHTKFLKPIQEVVPGFMAWRAPWTSLPPKKKVEVSLLNTGRPLEPNVWKHKTTTAGEGIFSCCFLFLFNFVICYFLKHNLFHEVVFPF